jgi:nucleotide-binding universal stress UspA family protein
MARENAPVLIAYDGSEIARSAVGHAGHLFAGRPAVVATVYEPGLAALALGGPDTMGSGAMGFGAPLPDPETLDEIDRVQREYASAVAADGAEFARSVGLVAEPQAVPDAADVADTLIGIARERDAAVVVVGSHGISGLRSRLLGSVTRKLIEHCDRPILVIRDHSS